MALDVMARTASLRARPLPRPEVLVVCGDHAGEPSRDLEPDLLDRLPGLRLICHLAAPGTPSRAPSAPGIPTVVVEGSDPASAIVGGAGYVAVPSPCWRPSRSMAAVRMATLRILPVTVIGNSSVMCT